MPAEPIYDAEPGDRGDIPRGGAGGSSTGGVIPPATQPVSPYPGLVYRSGFWYDAAADQWYDQNFQKLRGNPLINRPGPVEPGGLGPPGTMPPGSPDPGDGPVPGTPAGPNQIPGLPTSGPGSVATNYLNVPPAWSGRGPYQLANPMPTMPEMGTAPMQAYQAWALQQGRGGSGQPFTPWGSPIGQVSNILRYGGSPRASEQGGFEGSMGAPSGPGAPINVPGVPGWTSPGPGPGGTAGGLPGRTGGTGGQGYTPPAGGGGAGLPGRVHPEGRDRSETPSQRMWREAGERDQPRQEGTGYTVDQLRLLLATQGAILRGL